MSTPTPTSASSSQFTAPPWCFTEFFWHSYMFGSGQHLPWGSTRTALLPITATMPPGEHLVLRITDGVAYMERTTLFASSTPTPATLLQVRQNAPECYPGDINSVHSTGECPFGWTFAATVSSTSFCCPSGFNYAETRTLDSESLFITTRCTSTFGSGTYHPTVTVSLEYDTFRILNKWVTDGTLPVLSDSKASTWRNLYAEATPYRILSPPESDKLKPTENQLAVPTAPAVAESGSAMSPGALVGIIIGVLLLAAALFLLWWRRIRRLKSKQFATLADDDDVGSPGQAGLELKLKVADEEAGAKGLEKPAPAYELDNAQPAMFPVEADHGQKHGHKHEFPMVFMGSSGFGPQELPGTSVERKHGV
ncbi:hypothetical protein QBC39DRAFT_365481 [Podospora conica]|nr:hypothetical protein QBC39DRAFT_365481 [Schizothecium conicum]